MITLQTSKILARVEDGIGWLTFNQPERRNAVSLEMWKGIGDALEIFQHDDAVRVVVLHGAGFGEAKTLADELARQRQLTYIHGYDGRSNEDPSVEVWVR